MRLKLRALTGSRAGKEFSVRGERYLIGRSEQCQLRPKSESISRRHCIIALKDDRIVIQDLHSRNGTFVNGKLLPVDRARVLKPGDVVKIGKLEFQAVFQADSHERDRQLDIGSDPQVVPGSTAPQSADGPSDSPFEDVDISEWLGEIDSQETPAAAPIDTETSRLNPDETAPNTQQSKSDENEAGGRPPKRKPTKLPSHLKSGDSSDSSTSAASDALRRFFGRQ